jgi:hypothetical protein
MNFLVGESIYIANISMNNVDVAAHKLSWK